jgi:ATP-dependent Lhr-like helicase
MRGDVRRGYFVRGLAGAQFATAAAVDALRDVGSDIDAPAIAMSTSDPANAYTLPVTGESDDRPAIAKPRGRGGLLVTRRGQVVLSAEARGQRIAILPDASDEDVKLAAASLVAHLTLPLPAGQRRQDLEIETIDGAAATRSHHVEAFVAAGFRRDGLVLRKAVDFAR